MRRRGRPTWEAGVRPDSWCKPAQAVRRPPELTAHAATNDLAKLFDDLFQFPDAPTFCSALSAKRVQRDAFGCVGVGVVGGAGGGGDGAGVDSEIAAVVVACF